MSGKAFSSTGSPPLRAYCAPEVVRNTVGSPLGGHNCGGTLQIQRKIIDYCKGTRIATPVCALVRNDTVENRQCGAAVVTACDSLQVTMCKIKLEKTNFIIDKGKFLCYNDHGQHRI